MTEVSAKHILLDRTFDDFDELAVAVKHWDLDLRQLDSGPFEGGLFQAKLGRFLFAEARFGRILDQRGAAPPGMRTFGLPARPDIRFNWRKNAITGNDILLFPRSGELQSISQPDFHVFTVSLPECLLLEAIEASDACGVTELLQAETVCCDPSKMAVLREFLGALVLFAKGNRSLLPDSTVLRELECSVSGLLVDALLGPREAPNGAISRLRDLGIERARTFIDENVNKVLTVRDVCQAADVSERTLQYGFLEHIGITPKAYLKAIRLNGVRRELRNAEPEVRVNQVALRWGFWHMSQFAADYRKQFGELPSKTLQYVTRSH